MFPSSPDSSAAATPNPTHRSRVANGSKLLSGIDGRSALARRYRDLIQDLRTHLGGSPSAAQEVIIRRAATLAAWAEAREAAALAGTEELDIGPFTTACNLLRRLIQDLGLEAVARQRTCAPELQT